MEKTALIVIDVQNDFLESPGFDDKEGLLRSINESLPEYDLIVFTKLCLPEGSKLFKEVPSFCVKGTPGSFIHEGIDFKSIKKDIYFFKKCTEEDMEPWSVFYDVKDGKRVSTELPEFLKDKGIDSVDFCGVSYANSILNSLLDCAFLGFGVSILGEASRIIREDENN